ncbi:SDR family oxidoreductase [Solitalea canadensis]|uniref:Short-chain alcohol dehydrogenase n=1 Tax=Solitalea canadensis (strain ATCC 29591 / DSM 3403 / JCM 21819 / LMG 8368 / NBRC 15130 / NCIMB 12057 / USAM 9D) TaxID=929556 RepID=H8KR94_SOLCM|nr:SDR family oxidoreductase [Solitalea canadensis]AFD07361.1 short-chain alcohol dehydrogenase [Solitalea canadensis DSM 3403]
MTKKAAIITGATRGIGRSTAFTLARKGFNVVLVGRTSADLDVLANELANEGLSALPIKADVSQEADALMVVERTLAEFDEISLLVNNAGIGVFLPADQLETTDWDTVMDTNVKGTFLMSKAVVPYMKANKSGHIISIASDVSKRTFETGSLYCASKYAQDAFCSGLRKEVRRYGIKVSVIYPGLVDTYFHANGPGTDEGKTWLMPQDIADAIAYVATAPKHVVIDELMIHPMSQEY